MIKKLAIAFAALVAVIVAVSLATSGGGSGTAKAPDKQEAPAKQEAPKPRPPAHKTVEYIVTGTPGAGVTYGPAGTNHQGKSPMHITERLGDPAYYSVTAQLNGSGHVKVVLKVNGKVVSHGEATGGYNIASAEIVDAPFGGWIDSNG